MFGCFIDEPDAVSLIEQIGIDNVMAEADYPHTDSSWPHTLETMHKRLAGRSDADMWKVLQGNARRVFDFEPAAPTRKEDS